MNTGSNDQLEQHLHVVFLVDTTGSMGKYFSGLKQSLCQVNALLSVLFPSKADVSIISYADYCDFDRLFQKVQGNYKDLSKYCASLQAQGGGDMAEASKTAFNILFQQLELWKDDTAIVFHYTDAPPHHKMTNPDGSNRAKELRALAGQQPGYDWCNISRSFRNLSDRVRIFTIVEEDEPADRCGASFFALVGELIELPSTTASVITRATMDILLQLFGQVSEQSIPLYQRVGFRNHEDVMQRLHDETFDEDSFPELNTAACKEPTITKTIKNTEHLTWAFDHQFHSIPHIKLQLNSLKSRFKNDERFRDIVFDVMGDLINPENVMALTTNMVFGRLWRLVCTCREDDRLNNLVVKMGSCAGSSSLLQNEREQLRAWIEDSYDNAEEINTEIKNHQHGCTRYFVMDAFAQEYIPDVNGLRSLARSPSPEALANVQKILSHILLVSQEENLPVDVEGNLRYLPDTFNDHDLFTMLPHLMHAGSIFSLKPAAMLAILCCKNPDSLLFERAHRFLLLIKGKWLPPVERIDRPEILSYEFSALLATGIKHVDFLTEKERHFFIRLHEIWRYRRGRFQEFDLLTPLAPTTPMLLPDFKQICRKCSQPTSTTLLNSEQVCGICLWMEESQDNKWKRPTEADEYFVKETESYIIECTLCQVLYAVLGPADLKVRPRCHYCRGLDKKRGNKSPYRRCGCCKAKWCHPAYNNDDESGTYLCAVCTSADASVNGPVPPVSVRHHNISLNTIVEHNPEWVKRLGFCEKAGPIIFSKTKLSEAVTVDRQALFLELCKDDVVDTPLELQGRPILNKTELLESVQETIASATFMDTCQLCFEEKAVERLRLACGRCTNRCCEECLMTWYRQNAPGHLFIPTHDMCPFCRQRPLYHVLNQYNHQACCIVGLRRRKGAKLHLRSDWYYGWCQSCWKVSYAMARSCTEDGAPTSMTNFVCEDCEEQKQMRHIAEGSEDEEERMRILLHACKPCPECKMMTTHLGGCSHMNCPNCLIHWCWQCGEFKANDASKVYEHMLSEHGGYGFVDDEE